jgi:hypothetical protein
MKCLFLLIMALFLTGYQVAARAVFAHFMVCHSFVYKSTHLTIIFQTELKLTRTRLAIRNIIRQQIGRGTSLWLKKLILMPLPSTSLVESL